MDRGGGDSRGLREGRSERTKGPQLSITEPKVARSKARPPPPVLPDRRFPEAPNKQKVEAATPEPEEKARQRVATSEATAESEGGPSREDPRPERAGTEGAELGEPPCSHASEGPEAAVEIPAEAQGPSPLEIFWDVLSEEKKVPSDCWWIVTDKEALGNFSMFEHELRSHLPFSSSCEVCLRARGLKPALRRSQVHEHEVQLDQFWHGSLRVLIMVHSRSFAIGCVSGDMTRDMIVAGMSQWMLHSGLANKSCVFTCDAEGYMRTLWHDMLEEFPVFQGTIEQFAPGRHAPVAERGVRALRETVSGILIQMQDKGMGLRNNRKAFNFVFQHGCHCHNRYSMLSGSALTPIQRLRGNQHKPHQAYVFRRPGRYTYGAYLGSLPLGHHAD